MSDFTKALSNSSEEHFDCEEDSYYINIGDRVKEKGGTKGRYGVTTSLAVNNQITVEWDHLDEAVVQDPSTLVVVRPKCKRIPRNRYGGWTLLEMADGKDRSDLQITRVVELPGTYKKVIRYADDKRFKAKHPVMKTRLEVRELKKRICSERHVSNANSWASQNDEGYV